MADITEQIESDHLPVGVFELPGEPAIIINGVPDIPSAITDIVLKDVPSVTQSAGNTCCGEWLEGREVRKWFDGKFYSGTVTQYDKETGWYRVVYEDGDSEDLDWKEFEEVLLPLDVTIPLKEVAKKIMKMKQNPVGKSGIGSATSESRLARKSGIDGKNIEENKQIPKLEN